MPGFFAAGGPDFHCLPSTTAPPTTSYSASRVDLIFNFVIMCGHRPMCLKVTQWEPLSQSSAKPTKLLTLLQKKHCMLWELADLSFKNSRAPCSPREKKLSATFNTVRSKPGLQLYLRSYKWAAYAHTLPLQTMPLDHISESFHSEGT